jgi:hypothetical protein
MADKTRNFLIVLVVVVALLGFVQKIGITQYFFQREVSQDQRRAEAVQAVPLPVEPIKVIIQNKPRNCLQIDKAEVDGSNLAFYYHNVCAAVVPGYVEFRWVPRAADGTAIRADYQNKGFGREPGRNEYIYPYFTPDPRIVSIEVYVKEGI